MGGPLDLRPTRTALRAPLARVRRALHAGLDLLFPPRCVGCGRLGHAFCPICAQAVEPVPAPFCARCGHPLYQAADLCRRCRDAPDFPLVWVRAAALHRSPLREAIHGLKYEGRMELAEPLARYLVAVFGQDPWPGVVGEIQAVIPVPLHPDRLAERGYNQAGLLAQAFARRVGLPMAESWLVRVQATRSQVGLSAQERRRNVAHAFRADPAVAGHTLLLVDDVFTTGATLTAAARALREAGAQAVYGLALATPVLTPQRPGAADAPILT